MMNDTADNLQASEIQENNSLRVKLINFNEIHDDDCLRMNSGLDTFHVDAEICLHDLFQKLKEKMRSRKRIPKAFSRKFEATERIGDNIVSNPYDAKISYKLQYIVISDYSSHLIHVFDLVSKELKTSFKSGYPMYLEIDEYHSPHSDALLVACDVYPARSVYKYDLLMLFSKQSNDDFVSSRGGSIVINKSFVWKTENLGWPQGIACTPNFVYVCDSYDHSRCVYMINRQTGATITTISVGQACYGIAVARNEKQFFVGKGNGDIDLVEMTHDNQYVITNYYKMKHSGSCYGLIYDRASDVILGALSNITVLSMDGTVLKIAKDSTLKGAKGFCLNELEGELYICSRAPAHVTIVK
ncbi:hypothetical protein C9374_000260 [Naegleria lovaniensis]|uniref:Uncharacterized protein n=1 Tax=Naegleria lovaniensis TaxID=51637 RepID=A0AA88GZF0_NAELO|nr:uncharacterized protein C9374_000260 [Naegleria lovaniensis]KAG2388821.1 hypothetical protein C9374_000260 [Naegleria lovaniensis]